MSTPYSLESVLAEIRSLGYHWQLSGHLDGQHYFATWLDGRDPTDADAHWMHGHGDDLLTLVLARRDAIRELPAGAADQHEGEHASEAKPVHFGLWSAGVVACGLPLLRELTGDEVTTDALYVTCPSCLKWLGRIPEGGPRYIVETDGVTRFIVDTRPEHLGLPPGEKAIVFSTASAAIAQADCAALNRGGSLADLERRDDPDTARLASEDAQRADAASENTDDEESRA